MPHSFKLSQRVTRLQGPVIAATILAFSACQSTESLGPNSGAPQEAIRPDAPTSSQVTPAPDFAVSYAGGIPFGNTDHPSGALGGMYNGTLLAIWPEYLKSTLAAIKAAGGKVMINFAGNQKYFKDASGHFSMTMWKQRIDRYKGVDFSPYINDGTIIGHYLIDEPNDPANFNGQPVPGSTVEQMAQYSKQLWPHMPTIVRAEAGYMAKWSGTYKYLDGAWAQYVSWKGTPNDFLARNISAAQAKGLTLVAGLNTLKGGTNGSSMTASQVKTWGAAMLSSSYPCAFLNWQYNADYLSSSTMKDSMKYLRNLAQNRTSKSCRSS